MYNICMLASYKAVPPGLSSTLVFLRSPFRATVHYPLRLEQASS